MIPTTSNPSEQLFYTYHSAFFLYGLHAWIQLYPRAHCELNVISNTNHVLTFTDMWMSFKKVQILRVACHPRRPSGCMSVHVLVGTGKSVGKVSWERTRNRRTRLVAQRFYWFDSCRMWKSWNRNNIWQWALQATRTCSQALLCWPCHV